MSDIFISYARKDRKTAQRLAQALEAQGWPVWWDTRLNAGEFWDEVIERELAAARCVVVLWSKISVQRNWVRVEANEGLKRGILVPVRIENVEPPLAFRRVHARDLIDWKGHRAHPGFKQLMADVAKLLSASPKPIQPDASAAFVADIAAQEDVDQRKGAEESTAASVNNDVEDEETDTPASCETTEFRFYYSDKHIWIEACLPNINIGRYAGSCAIGFRQTSLDDCIITLNHHDILSTLLHGHHSGVDVVKRRIIAFGPSKEFNKYAIDIGGTRLFLSERVVRSLCSAIDALYEAYLEALKRIDSAWEADGFSYENSESGAVVVRLGTLSSRMWSHIVEFAEKHDCEHGDSEWHMFDANDMSLVIHSPTPTRRFDEGMHVHVSAIYQSPADTLTNNTVTLLWNPPFRYGTDIYPLSERRYWGAATTFRWINEELIPKTYEWIWSNQPLKERLSPRAEQHKTKLYSELKDYGMLVNYERQHRQSMNLHGSLPDLRRLVATLQEEFQGASDAEYIFKKEMMSNLYHAITLCWQHVNCKNFNYIASKLDVRDVQDKEQLIEKLKENIKQDDLSCSRYPIELALRSILFLLRSSEVFLNNHEMKQIAFYLNPLIEIYREVDMRRRHGLK